MKQFPYNDLREFLSLVDAMGSRCNPEDDLDILRKNWSSRLDPVTVGKKLYNSRVIIDACIPYERREDFPKVAQTSPEYKQTMMKKYGNLIREIIRQP